MALRRKPIARSEPISEIRSITLMVNVFTVVKRTTNEIINAIKIKITMNMFII